MDMPIAENAIRTKVLVLRTLGGNKSSLNSRQTSHYRIWDEMNNIVFGIADYHQNKDPHKGYDIYDQIVKLNHGNQPDWSPESIAFIIGIYTTKYHSKHKDIDEGFKGANFASILYPYQNEVTKFITAKSGIGSGIDIAFKFHSKLESISSVNLDKIVVEIKREEFHGGKMPCNYAALCFTIELNKFLNKVLEKLS